ncbi:aminoglycoside phosphotransferase (APT) family kinase protein [Rhodococcus opacus]|nr:aminoglycoside phosphotransferase (APT) family kinase protein [Rhodococcus opacus]
MTSHVESRPIGDVDDFVLAALAASIADELVEVGRLTTDPGLSARLNNSGQLLRWVRSQLTMDRAEVADAEARLRDAPSVRNEPDPSRGAAIRRLLDARKGPTFDAGESAAAIQAATPPKPPTAEEVTAYLQHRRPDLEDRAHAVRTLVGGFSKVTLLVDCTLNGIDQEIVLRQIPRGRKASSLSPEFDVLTFVHGHGLPAPRPLWIETAENELGGAFFATERAPGANIGDVWGQEGASRELCLEMADLYASLHQLPTAGVNAPISPRSTPSELGSMITWQKDTLDKRGIEIEPVLEALLLWLESHIPAEPPRKALIHGDAAFSNLLVQDSHVSAVLDWEAAHVGDPAAELAYLKPSVEPVMPWNEFVERYVAAGGIAPAPDAMKFFEVWSHVWRHIGCLWLAQNFEQTGRYASAVAAYVHGPRFLDEGVKAAFL